MPSTVSILVDDDEGGGYVAAWGTHSAHGETPAEALAEFGNVLTMVCEEYAADGVPLPPWLLMGIHPST